MPFTQSSRFVRSVPFAVPLTVPFQLPMPISILSLACSCPALPFPHMFHFASVLFSTSPTLRPCLSPSSLPPRDTPTTMLASR
eukprot:751401-Hanusia_phi.AAC.3